MITAQQKRWTKDKGWTDLGKNDLQASASLVFAFGGSGIINQPDICSQIQAMYPKADIVLASTAGEILDSQVSDNTVALTAVSFDTTKIVCHKMPISKMEDSAMVGQDLGAMLDPNGLVHAMVFSDGLKVNGTALVQGLAKSLPSHVSVTGGLVGDGADFKHTYVGLNAPAQEAQIIVVGFYGEHLKVGYGSFGGWDVFGPERVITKSKGNVLYELDGKSALELYKEYLGDLAKNLPSSGLLFPLSLKMPTEIVRTLLAIDEKEGSMTFAGDMPEGVVAKLMKANFEHLVEGASDAANMSLISLREKPELAIAISCVGRKLVLKERVEEELEAVRSMLGADAAITGFYSYGEICPTAPTEKQCQLHNQTMTITIFKED